MTAADCKAILSSLLAEDLDAVARRDRMRRIALVLARVAPTPELRTAARMHAQRLGEGLTK